MPANHDLDQLCANTIRMLAADGVQQAKSGHPGMPMGMADVAYVLWTRHLRYNPRDPQWPNRDRFVLSAGHGSMLLYSLLHLSGYDLPLEELKRFRQLGSKTPGHPEYGVTPGVECTTGPQGQGLANAVGMALGAKIMAEKFNAPGRALIDHYVYAICGDGDLMEGVSAEAASLAGHLGLGNIVFIYDDNSITIEGKTELAFSEDVAARFEAYGWHTLRVDGHDMAAVDEAITAGKQETARPTLILAKTHIGMGSPNKQDTHGVHGEPLGEEELAATREALGWPAEPRFYIPDEVREVFAARQAELLPVYESWRQVAQGLGTQDAALAAEWEAMWSRTVPSDVAGTLAAAVGDEKDATRNHGGKAIQAASAAVPALYGGSADLAPSTKTLIKGAESIGRGSFGGRNLHFGIREHAMGAMLNGMALYGAFIPYGSTFLVFSDYMRPAIRVAAISKIPLICVFTHDSIFVGEDGPTHEPIEQIPSLRVIPNVTVLRPADGPETAAAWAIALQRTDGPTALCLTRQALPPLPPPNDPQDLMRGAYVLSDCEGEPELIVIGTGSETHLALQTAELLKAEGIAARSVSMPSCEVFDAQDEAYRQSVLPATCTARVAVEAAAPMGWARYVGCDGLVIGMDTFGESAPYKDLGEHFGFTVEKVLARVKQWWAQR